MKKISAQTLNQVASGNGNMVELASDPGFTIGSDGKVIFHTSPKNKHEGPLNYKVFVR